MIFLIQFLKQETYLEILFYFLFLTTKKQNAW